MQFTDRDIHIVQGDSAGGTMRQLLGPLSVNMYAHRDVLSYGPLTSVDKLDHWEALRWAFWGMKGKPKPDDWLHRRLHADRDRLRGAERVFLWFGAELSQPILVGWLVAIFKQLGLDNGRFRLPDLSKLSYCGQPVPSIGLLKLEELDKIEEWQVLTAENLWAYEALWLAVTSESAQDLNKFCAPESTHTQALKQAVQAYMTRYPMVGDGLAAWDRLLLENCRVHGPSTVRVIAHTMSHDMPYPDSPGDFYLFDRLKRLGEGNLLHPLVRLTGDTSAIRFCETTLTAVGERVLNGDENAIALNGVDDWIGGVHLNSREGTLWLHDGGRLVPSDVETGCAKS